MATRDLIPEGEALRRAVTWLAEQGPWTLARIETACRRFDLSPLDEQFLLSLRADPPVAEHLRSAHRPR